MTKQKLFIPIIIGLLLVAASAYSDIEGKQAHQAKEKPVAHFPREVVGKDGAPMVLIPAGEFQMGTAPGEIPQLVQWAKNYHSGAQSRWFERETPRHTVHLDAFYIGKYEVTNRQYRRFVQETGHGEPEGRDYMNGEWQFGIKTWSDKDFNGDDQPVVCVSWEDAKAYAEWAGKRLPTEAEWEKAARGGLVGKKFPWGDSDPDGTQCNFADRHTNYNWPDKNADDGYEYTAPVGGYPPNAYGLYDMAGNVWEWCSDWYHSGYYANSPTRNPTGPSLGDHRVFRGGSWHDRPEALRVALRDGWYPAYASSHVGFRCVASRSD